MARCIDKVQLIGLSIPGGIVQGDALGLDGDTALALDIHGIEHLLIHFPGTQTPTVLNKTIG